MCSEWCTVIKNPAVCCAVVTWPPHSWCHSDQCPVVHSRQPNYSRTRLTDSSLETRISIHTHTHTHTFSGPLSGTTRVSRYQKGKTNLDFTEARDISSGISWAMCKSAPRSRQITTPAPHYSSFFTGRLPFLPPNQQCRSTEGRALNKA